MLNFAPNFAYSKASRSTTIEDSLIVVINLLNSNSLLFNKFFSVVVGDESDKTWGPNNWDFRDPISVFPLWF